MQLPLHFSREEIDQLRARALEMKPRVPDRFLLSDFVRGLLGLPKVRPGAPAGNRNWAGRLRKKR